MKTKREVLELFSQQGNCTQLNCNECAYNRNGCLKNHKGLHLRLAKIGAMTILRMFPERKKPLLENGTKIKFSNGRIATLVKTEPIDSFYRLDFGGYSEDTDYLIGRTWEVVE